MSTFEQAVAEHLRSAPDPYEAIRRTVIERRSEGDTREEIYEALGRVARRLRSAGRAADEDVVVDVMDLLVGWCAPDRRID